MCTLFDTIHHAGTFLSGNMHHVIVLNSFPVEITHYIHSFVMIPPSSHTSILLFMLEELVISGKSVVTPHVTTTEDLLGLVTITTRQSRLIQTFRYVVDSVLISFQPPVYVIFGIIHVFLCATATANYNLYCSKGWPILKHIRNLVRIQVQGLC